MRKTGWLFIGIGAAGVAALVLVVSGRWGSTRPRDNPQPGRVVKASVETAGATQGPARIAPGAPTALPRTMVATDAVEQLRAALWARKDPQAALARASGLPQDSGYRLALAGSSRGTNRVEALPVGYTSNTMVRRIAAFLTGEDSPQAGAEFAASLPGGSAAPVLQIVLARWAAQDPGAATAWAQQLPDPQSRGQALSVVTQAQAPTQTTTTRTTLSSTTTSTGLSGSSTAADGPSGFALATSNSTPSATVLPSDILGADLPIAIALAEQLPDGSERDAVMHSLALQWANEDPAAAAAWVIGQMPQGLELDATLCTIVWDWAQNNSTQALTWVDQLTDASLQVEERATVAMALARTDPSSAIVVAASLPPGETKSNVMVNIAFQWAMIDPTAATAWAQSLSVDDGRDPALAAIESASN